MIRFDRQVIDLKQAVSFIDNRRQKILNLLEQYGHVKVSFLAEEMSTSPLTIRRDLEYLSQQLLLERHYGGATLLNPVSTSFSSTLVLHKHAIAQEAAKLVQDHDSIFINTSSTATLILKYITAKNVTVITNNAKAIQCERSSDILVVLTGGELREPKESMVGDFALNNLMRVTASKCFLGCAGLTPEQGLTTSVLQEASINETMLNRATQRIILADHSKIGKTQSFVSGNLRSGDRIITDTESPRNILDRFRKKGIEVIQVPPLRSLK